MAKDRFLKFRHDPKPIPLYRVKEAPPPPPQETVSLVPVRVDKETEKGLLVTFRQNQDWIPKRHIVKDLRHQHRLVITAKWRKIIFYRRSHLPFELR